MANPLRSFVIASLAALLLGSSQLLADGARFDLTGPKLGVRVTRAGVTLPIAEVPNLQPGDKLWVHTDFPATQSVRYLLVVAFLRGTTNPPPDSWFTRIETWNRDVRDEGTFITVPNEAQQVLLFLAPETGGDFSTLRSAVKGRPGLFVRASQDLNEAGFEQARIEKYLDAMRAIPPTDVKALQKHSALLAATLALKPNEACFKQPVDQQYNCLTQTGSQMLLDDGHGQTVAEALSAGPSGDLINSASNTQVAGGGLYSAYVGTIIDLVRLTSGLHTAQYQYIPAIAFPEGEQLNLRLNAAPSFHNPKSVIVIGLPAIQSATPPPLSPADPKRITCMLEPKLVFGLEGAPLVYSTGFAHDLVLHLNTPHPTPDLPLIPSAFDGGLIPGPKPQREVLPVDLPEVTPSSASSDQSAGTKHAEPVKKDTADNSSLDGAMLTGTVKGMWGFDPFTGPTLRLQNVPGTGWKLVTTDPLIAGQDNHLTIASTGTACIQSVTAEISHSADLKSTSDEPTKLDWKLADTPNEVALTLPLKIPAPDAVHLEIKQFGQWTPETLTAKALSEPAKLEALHFHAGDTTAVLTGSRLDQVKQVDLKGVIFLPSSSTQQPSMASDSQANAADHLELSLPQSSEAQHPDQKSNDFRLVPGEQIIATVTLKDGRTLALPTTVEPHRPVVTLLSKSIDRPENSPIHVAPEDLPLDDKFTFFLKSAENFPRAEQIEIASPDDSLHAMLSIASGTLILQNRHTVFATLDPLKLFGTSAYGPLHLRAVAPDGTTGDWIPLVTLVRLPDLTQLQCPVRARQQPCTLTGSNLYLVDSFSTDPSFTVPVPVPEGFIGTTVALPRPAADGGFYLRLRDDPTANEQVTLPILPLQGPQPGPQLTLPAPAPPVNPAPIPVMDPADSTAPAPATSHSAPSSVPGNASSNAPGNTSSTAPGTAPVQPSSPTPAPHQD